jgi:hypothetical protein
MSLLNVKLPDTVLAALFKNTVVQSAGDEVAQVVAKPMEQPEAAPEPVQPPVAKKVPVSTETPVSTGAYKFLGKNQRRITIIVHFPDDVFLPDNHLQFLVKMLGACKLTMADVAIVNAATTPLLADKLKEQLAPAFMLLFGVEPTDIQLPLSFPSFKEQQYANCKYLLTPALATLNQDNEDGKQLKRKLWDCLKAMFGV